jgi:tRNA modification GTPase
LLINNLRVNKKYVNYKLALFDYDYDDRDKMIRQEDTITAIATPVGEGGLGVIRISGVKALEIADTLFEGKRRIRDMASHSAAFGNFVEPTKNRRIIDEVVVVLFRSPHSYTGEDVIEISCHGGMLVTKRILNALFDSGARHATPGEFTKRAFLNGRIDLSQAEAVADIIHARTERAHQSSLDQLKGKLSREIEAIRNDLINFSSLIELELDFAEEDIELVNRDEFVERTQKVMFRLEELIQSFTIGKVYRDGIKVVLAGKPNAGKSSLLNTLLQENRAIVNDIPGTTRDTIEESLNIDGILFRIIDTAGLRETNDPVESEGVQRTLHQIERADLALMIIDYSQNMSDSDLKYIDSILDKMKALEVSPLVVFNKIDIATRKQFANTGKLLHYPFVKLSAKTGDGVDALKDQMVKIALHGKPYQEGGVLVTNARHRDALIRAKNSLELALTSLKEGASGEFISVDLRSALDALGEITGVVTTEDILNNIFSNFCIGK